MRLVIDMPWERDLSVNHMRYGKGGGYRKKEHVQCWMLSAEWTLSWRAAVWKDKTGNWQAPELPVCVRVDFRFPDRRKRDSHNYFKVIADSVAAGLGIDDKDIRISTGSVSVDRNRPGFKIMVEDGHGSDN